MTRLRVGTRGSDLALWQTAWVSDRLREIHTDLEIERIIIKTHGDLATTQRFDADWPVGGFVGAIEQSLAAREIDFAVHSYKDLQTAQTPGLIVAAIPERETPHDLLVTGDPVDLNNLPAGFKIGTSSPRRAAQFRRFADVEIVEIRGNVPTRVAKVETDAYDGVILAAAGVKRLELTTPHSVELPLDGFLPAPAQGALAIQTRDEADLREILAALDHAGSRRTVEAERAFLATIGAGCHVPVAALANLDGDMVALRGQLFTTDGARVAQGGESGVDSSSVGRELAERLLAELG